MLSFTDSEIILWFKKWLLNFFPTLERCVNFFLSVYFWGAGFKDPSFDCRKASGSVNGAMSDGSRRTTEIELI